MFDREVLRRAAEAGMDYRAKVASGEGSTLAPYSEVLDAFSGPLPETPAEASEVIDALIKKASPGLRAMTSASFFGWVIGGSHLTGVAADWLTSAWGQNAGNVFATPAAAAAEQASAAWLLELLDLPRTASVGFVTGATMANFVGLAAARSEQLRRRDWDVEKDGLFGAPPITVMIGADAHATVFNALRYLGLGSDRVVTIPTDELGRIRADALESEMQRVAGPVILVAQAGQLNTGACDPFAEICAIARRYDAWVHVDGAFGLWAQASPRFRHLTEGVQLADSWATDGHKWLQLPYDSGFVIVKDRAAHRRAMSLETSYLPPAGEEERDPSAYVPELSRRARGFAAWSVIKALGRSGIAEMVERNCDFAAALAETCADLDGVQVVATVSLNQLLLRFADSDDATRATIENIQRRGCMFVGPALWHGDWVMRISVCNFETGPAILPDVVTEIAAAWQEVRQELYKTPMANGGSSHDR